MPVLTTESAGCSFLRYPVNLVDLPSCVHCIVLVMELQTAQRSISIASDD